MADTITPHPERAGMLELFQSLADSAGPNLLEAVAAQDMDELAIRPGALLSSVASLRAAGFNHLMDVGGVDHHPLSPRFEVAYHFAAIPLELAAKGASTPPLTSVRRFRLRVFPDDRTPLIPSLAGVWPSADWAEREVYDLFGVRFDAHPNLARLLNPFDWIGHPLRKDYPLRGLERRFSPGGHVGPVPPVKES